jgi:hypothetical protein
MSKVLVPLLAFALISCGRQAAPNVDTSDVAEAALVEPAHPQLRHDIPTLIGAPKSAIDAKWGQPECPPKNACVYGDKMEVYFVNGKAANFTLPPASDPSEYGFSLGEPSFTNEGVKRWDLLLNGMPIEISSFENHYFYVKTRDP